MVTSDETYELTNSLLPFWLKAFEVGHCTRLESLRILLARMTAFSFKDLRNVHGKLCKSDHPKAAQLLGQLNELINAKIPAFVEKSTEYARS